MPNVYILFSIFLFFSAIGGGVYYYYTTTQNTIISLTENNVQLKSNNDELVNAVGTANNTIDYLQNSYEEIQTNYQNAQNEIMQIRMDNAVLRDKLEKHELDVLAYSKPQLVENIINNATDKANRCFEILSGSALTETERNASNGQQFNSECPFLFDPNFSD